MRDVVLLICMNSYLVERVASNLLCIRPVNALEMLRMCVDSHEHSLLEPATNIKNSSAGSYK